MKVSYSIIRSTVSRNSVNTKSVWLVRELLLTVNRRVCVCVCACVRERELQGPLGVKRVYHQVVPAVSLCAMETNIFQHTFVCFRFVVLQYP